ncbi:MAG: EAL domain-containing protein [Bacilli bacterium]|nr:EAL domain-containing protein [Bacilli bacterium]
MILSILARKEITHNYVWHYAACSLVYLSVIVVLCFRQKKIPTFRGKVFKWLILFSLANVFFDLCSAWMLSNAYYFNWWSLTLINCLYLSFACTVPALYTVYATVLINRKRNRKTWLNALYFLPTILTFIVIWASFFTTGPSWSDGIGAFYIRIDPRMMTWGYSSGPSFFLIYAIPAICIFYVYFLLLTTKKVTGTKKAIIYFIMTAVVVSMIFQLVLKDAYNDGYRTVSTGNALAMVFAYFEIESPGDYIDKDTDAFNEMAFQTMTQEYLSLNVEFSTVILTCTSYDAIMQQFGTEAINGYINEIYRALCAPFNKKIVYRIARDSFAVLMKDVQLTEQAVKNLFFRLNPVFTHDDIRITNNIRIGYVSSLPAQGSYDKFYQTVIANVDALRGLKYAKNFICYADDKFLELCALRARQERALSKAIDEDGITVYYQPIHDGQNRIVAFEALARLFDDEIGPVPPDVFVTLAEKNGLILKLGDQIFNKIVKFAATGILEQYGVDHISVNLSMAQCMQEDLCERYKLILDKNKVKYDKIIFEITETEATDAMSIVRNLVDDFKTYGFKFSLDDFGSGYANFNYIFQLPFNIVKIDKTLLDVSQQDAKQKLLFKNVVKIIKDLKLECICEGVEREEQVKMLNTLGVTHHQGYFYSKPLCVDDLKIYLEDTVGPKKQVKGKSTSSMH